MRPPAKRVNVLLVLAVLSDSSLLDEPREPAGLIFSFTIFLIPLSLTESCYLQSISS